MSKDTAGSTPAPLPKFDDTLWTGLWYSARLGFSYFARLHDLRDDESVDPGAPPDDTETRRELGIVAAMRREMDTEAQAARRKRIQDQNGAAATLLAPWGLAWDAFERPLPNLAWLANHLGMAAARMPLMYYKAKYARARPFELDRSIQSLVANPGHASYPSGHTCQHRLAALVIDHVSTPIELDLAGSDPMALAAVEARRTELFAIAEDAAINREYAGVHFASDSAAGRRLADNMFRVMTETLGEPLATAGAEWRKWRRFGLPT